MIQLKAKNFFFDRGVVLRAVNRAKRTALSKAGAFIRRTAKSIIAPRKRVSRPGQPPSSHTGLLKRLIYFAWDPGSESVVIGPERADRMGQQPSVLEFGGRSTVTRHRRGRVEKHDVTIDARPYMGPAMQENLDVIPRQWEGAVSD